MRAIIHLDLDAFFCSVEVLKNPELKYKPIVVGGQPDKRGVVAAASYPARKFGIHSAMPMAQAVKLCQDLIIISHSFNSYKLYSKLVMGILKNFSSKIQQVSIDEAYLDLTEQIDEWDQLITIGNEIKKLIQNDTGLTSSLGLATNKMVAKIASDFEKPDGFTVVKPGMEKSFLAPMAVMKIPGIGPRTNEKLAMMNIKTIQELSLIPAIQLKQKFGKVGIAMSNWANGLDKRDVSGHRVMKSISKERTFVKDLNAIEELNNIIMKLASGVAKQLHNENFKAKTVIIKFRYSDFTTFTRQKSLMDSISEPDEIIKIASKLFRDEWDQTRSLRLLGVGVSNLVKPDKQIQLDL